MKEDLDLLDDLDMDIKSQVIIMIDKEGNPNFILIGDSFTQEQFDAIERFTVLENPSFILKILIKLEIINDRIVGWFKRFF